MKVENTRKETIEFAKQYNIKVVKLSIDPTDPKNEGKKSFDLGWNTPEVYEKNQEKWINGFLMKKFLLDLFARWYS